MGMDHLVFIPGVLLIGLVVGFVLGQRAALAELQRKRQRIKQ